MKKLKWREERVKKMKIKQGEAVSLAMLKQKGEMKKEKVKWREERARKMKTKQGEAWTCASHPTHPWSFEAGNWHTTQGFLSLLSSSGERGVAMTGSGPGTSAPLFLFADVWHSIAKIYSKFTKTSKRPLIISTKVFSKSWFINNSIEKHPVDNLIYW